MGIEFSDKFKEFLDKEHLEDIRDRIIVEMSSRSPVRLSPESAEFLLQTYTDKLGELYW